MRNSKQLKEIIFTLFILMTFIRCNQLNTENIIIKGKITDSITNLPISNAKVTVLCWYDAGWDKRNYESIDTITNLDGSFEVAFEEGYKIIVASIAANYKPKFKVIDKMDDTINLKLNKDNTDKLIDVEKISLRKFILKYPENWDKKDSLPQ